jgi:hypothetical protein
MAAAIKMVSWAGLLLASLLPLAGAINPNCVVAATSMNYLNETNVQHEVTFYCTDTSGHLKCSKLNMNQCVVNDDGKLRIKKL